MTEDDRRIPLRYLWEPETLLLLGAACGVFVVVREVIRTAMILASLIVGL